MKRLLLLLLVSCWAPRALAEGVPVSPPAKPAFTLGGYVEAFYQWNFNRPSNGITHYRGFDNRHDTFALSNLALDAQWDAENVVGRITLQVGLTPDTYYGAEPSLPGSAGANATDASLWKYVQQGYAGYRFLLPQPLLVTAGIFLSPIGPESMAVRDNWNWSRSNLFFGLPFYHTGVRAAYQVDDAWQVTLAAYNGWNSVIDNNRHKSLSAQVTYALAQRLSLSMLYLGGVERHVGAAEGQAFRHLFDTHATVHATRWLSLMAHVNGGFEPNRLGSSKWAAGALYARAQLQRVLFLALRGDVFREWRAHDGEVRASALFWPVHWLQSSTVTLEYRPVERAAFRLEYRNDRAASAAFFGRHVARHDDQFVANRKAQNTLTLGLTAFF